MKSGATLFLRSVLVLIGVGALAFLLMEPHFEGRNAQATPLEIYFHDPFLIYVYIGSIPFFLGLIHAFRLLGLVGRNQHFSATAVRSVRTIKFCALALLGFVAGAAAFIFAHESDDRAGGVAMCLFVAFASIVVAAAMALLERSLQHAVNLQSENDLTV
jgi:hypothetical protein